MDKHINIATPGEILLEEFLEPMNITPGALARCIKKDRTAIQNIIKGKRAITADMSILLDRALGLSDGFWFNIQSNFDLLQAKRRADLNALDIKPLCDAA